MYDEKAKARMMKYMHIKRESLQLNLPLGTKDLWKDYAADMGMSVTQLITKLIEKDMKEHNWTETFNPYNMASKPKETDDWQKWGFKPQKSSAQGASRLSCAVFCYFMGLQATFSE